ncbi:MAG: HAD family hydrolase [Lapillicoccus sp.]
MTDPDTVLLDIDGTLVDSTYHHALAWHRAFASHDVHQPVWRIHRAIGMGGDRLVAAVAGDDVEDRLGDALREAWETAYEPLRREVRVLPGAADLVRTLKEEGFRVALASSGKPEHTEQAVEMLGVEDLLDAVTTSEDADSSKPAPDIFLIALQKVGGTAAVVVGDSVHDIDAAKGLGAPCVAVRTGGFGVAELEEAGAVLVVDGPADLLQADWRALGRRPARA